MPEERFDSEPPSRESGDARRAQRSERWSADRRDGRGDARREERPDERPPRAREWRDGRGDQDGRGTDGGQRRGGYRGRHEDRRDGGYGARRDDRSTGEWGRSYGRSDERRGGYEADRGDGDRRSGYERRGDERPRDGFGLRRDDRGDSRRDERGDSRREVRDGGYGQRRDQRGERRGGGFAGRRDERSGERGGERRDGGRGAARGYGGREQRGGFDGRGTRGSGWSDEQASIRGPRSWDAKASGDDRPRRKPEPPLPEDISGYELDKAVRQQLRTLSKENAEGVARHLVAAAQFLDEDPQRALDHAQHAVSRAGRVPAAREALGLVLYRTGEFAEALREFRTARRLSGSDHLLPYLVDCERGLGRFDRALELANSPEAQRLSEADNIELAIVVSGVRRDMGQSRAAVVGLRIPALQKATTQPWAARLFYAYADALLDIDEVADAREWFVKADAADREGETDASERVDQIDGFELTDLAPEEEQEIDPRLAQLDLSAFGAARDSASRGEHEAPSASRGETERG